MISPRTSTARLIRSPDPGAIANSTKTQTVLKSELNSHSRFLVKFLSIEWF
ncbi:hypothetical protein M595_4737 [Lyngbya aestuarii BL J]|uniref:Uncharacterized protein n=1 Tax=Lyngbya aestuarii BL J TaxID=1348334 RepID=U7QE36_9CYAN|nr:hypothetical protein M595_4737 [Lyngbya aestuarii BL J]